jgi:hypothetical protein
VAFVIGVIVLAACVCWLVPALILRFTARENRAAAWAVLLWQLIPLGLLIAGTAVASHVDSELALVPVLLLTPSGFFAWRALAARAH